MTTSLNCCLASKLKNLPTHCFFLKYLVYLKTGIYKSYHFSLASHKVLVIKNTCNNTETLQNHLLPSSDTANDNWKYRTVHHKQPHSKDTLKNMKVCRIWYHLYNIRNVKNTHDECFSRFLNYANGTKSQKASQAASLKITKTFRQNIRRTSQFQRLSQNPLKHLRWTVL